MTQREKSTTSPLPRRFAHSVEGLPETSWEPLSLHLSAVGKRAAEFALWFGASTLALAMGLLHDIGKFSAAYQSYIRRPREAGGPKGPDHSTAGAKEAVQLYGLYGRLMAFGLAGHHSGLMNGSGYDGVGACLADRLGKGVEPYDGWQPHVADLPDLEAVKRGLPELKPNGIAAGFEFSFFIRMLFSCLVDADFLETERFYATASGITPPGRGGTVETKHLEIVRAHRAKARGDGGKVNRLRSKILDHAVGKADLPPGLFTLTVPTGGGKTLTSLRFALEHALRHRLRRVVYVIPFTSIIEQTAQVFREEVGLGDAVLEHHSSFDWDRDRPASDDEEGEGAAGLAKLRRDAENWDAPIVVTTAVQFFESLFAARTSKARKLHNLAGSVVILDEAQSIPVKLLRPCLAAIDELARNYGTSIVFCTATQPALRKADMALPRTKSGALEGLDIPDERELAPDPKGLYEELKRVKVEWRRTPVSDEEIAARFAEQPRMLCIVNSRAHARDLFTLLRDQGQEGAAHLTTLMCAQHRRDVLAKVRQDLKNKRPVRLVATSLIEAGVDVDFPEVWRAAAGLQNIAQSAGRCNREGHLDGFGRTVVFEPAGRRIPPAIDAFYGPARHLLRREGLDVLGLDAIAGYYRELYFQQGYEALDKATLAGAPFPIVPAISETTRRLEFPFSSIAQAFRMIDDVMDPVIVPRDEEAKAVITAIRQAPFPPAGAQRKLQQYTVPVPAKTRAALLGSGAAQAVRRDDYGDRFVVLESLSLYDPDLGLSLDDPTWRSSESNIIT
ncbi:CRISPR-associated endonuclease Cas3'' [Zavarzinia compransoris]|uniref:CRISPR-associated endonuclease Cas3 n=2 Tax=Zavarzinia compransoris TaxID=1264899 RepID=A0A317DWX7_9PROT|nr:CRISPR-associated endonuclease Cas3'' [Zavarzinia compransoris]